MQYVKRLSDVALLHHITSGTTLCQHRRQILIDQEFSSHSFSPYCTIIYYIVLCYIRLYLFILFYAIFYSILVYSIVVYHIIFDTSFDYSRCNIHCDIISERLPGSVALKPYSTMKISLQQNTWPIQKSS